MRKHGVFTFIFFTVDIFLKSKWSQGGESPTHVFQEKVQLWLALASMLQPVFPPLKRQMSDSGTHGHLRRHTWSCSHLKPSKHHPESQFLSKMPPAACCTSPAQCWMTRPHSRLPRRQARCPTISRCLLPRVRATFILFSESMKPTCRVRTQDRMTISFSAPWKASTVDTCTALTSGRSESASLSK